MIIDGKELAKKQNELTRDRISHITGTIKLSVILVGSNPDSIRYIERKLELAVKLGAVANLITLPPTTSKGEIVEIIDRLNNDPTVHGILLQMPFPTEFVGKYSDNAKTIVRELLDLINPLKDVDGLNSVNIGKYTVGDMSGFVPATPQGIMYAIQSVIGDDFAGKNAVVINRSMIVGKPVAMLLLSKDATVSILHSKSKNIGEYTKNADIIITGVGSEHFLTADMVKPGSVVIDVAITFKDDGKLTGDADTEEISKIAHITPVPKGIGPLTVSFLFANLVTAYERQNP